LCLSTLFKVFQHFVPFVYGNSSLTTQRDAQNRRTDIDAEKLNDSGLKIKLFTPTLSLGASEKKNH